MSAPIELQASGLTQHALKLIAFRHAWWIVNCNGYQGIASVKENGYAILEHESHDLGADGDGDLVSSFLKSVAARGYAQAMVVGRRDNQASWIKLLKLHGRIRMALWELESKRSDLVKAHYTMRRVCAADLEHVLEWVANRLEPLIHTREEFEHWMDVHADGFLCLVGENSEALGAAYWHWNTMGEAWLRGVGVNPACRRRGIGTALVRAVVQNSLDQGARRISVVSVEGEHQKFWSRCGFRQQNTFEIYYGIIRS